MSDVIEAANSAIEALGDIIDAGGKLSVPAASRLRALLAKAETPPDELIIPLRRPIVLGDTSYVEIKLHEPTAGEIEQWDSLTRIHADRKAVSVVASLPESVVRQIPAAEFYRAARYIGAFLD